MLPLAISSSLVETFGRLHVALVHFPIALLLLAGAIELVRAIFRKQAISSAAILCLILGTIAAIVSAWAGWVHAGFASYEGEQAKNLALHRWLGIAAAFLGVITLALLWPARKRVVWPYRVSIIAGAILVAIVGHLGGTLTHGEGYFTELLHRSSQSAPVVQAQTISLDRITFPKDGKIDFAAHVQPIFAARCNECHGPEKRRGALRLDSKRAVFKGGNSGPAIVANHSEQSLLIRRVLGQSNQKRMPLDHPPLSDEQIKILTAWIDQGAVWPADATHDAGAEEKHWAYVKPARPQAPSVHDAASCHNPIDNFILAKLESENLHPSPRADRGILMRRVCLDLVGIPPAPDEVDAFLADTSPDAYEKLVDRLLASPHYGEKWARPWLDLARYADSKGYEKDKPKSMWPWRDWVINALNSDMPFDEFTVEQLAGDLLPDATQSQRIASGFHRNTMLNEEGGVDVEETRDQCVVERTGVTATVWLGTTLNCAQCHNHKYDPFSQKEFYQFFAFFNSSAPELEPIKGSAGENKDISPHEDVPVYDRAKLEPRIAALRKAIDTPTPDLANQQQIWEQARVFRSILLRAQPIDAIVSIPASSRTPQQIDGLAKYFRHNVAASLKPARDELVDLETKYSAIAPSYVMKELAKPRPTFVHVRGSFMTPGEQVEADVPSAMSLALPKDAPRNRLTLARWIVDPENPLTARVAVNRIWEQYFGRGIVATSEDFGTQGEPPTHPHLLDWLATEFIRQKWSMKAIHRLIVTSATYQQQSNLTPDLIEKDPQNRLLARGPRFRLEAELIRDQALAVSGLLSSKMGGPSVYPSQPQGIWNVVYNADNKWPTSSGEDFYRRGVYTFWRRSAPYPMYLAFDAPTRESICTRRPRTNTPLQALTTLNDPAFVQPAAALARKIVREGGSRASDRVIYGFRCVLVRMPNDEEVGRLVALYQQQVKNFQDDPAAAKELATSGLSPPPSSMNVSELAAWTVVSNVLLNLDETLTKG